MSTSTIPLLRPLSLAELLDQAIRLYRNNFLKFVGIIAMPYIPLVVIQAGMSLFTASSMIQPSFDPSNEVFLPDASLFVGMLGAFIAIILQFFLVQGVATAALTRAVADNYLGRPAGIMESYRNLGGAWFRLILAILFVIVLLLVIMIWFLIPCVGWFTGFGILVFVAIVVNPLVAPVVVLENKGALASVRRAWDLGRSRFWWLIGFVFIINLFGQLVVTGPVLLVNWLMQMALLNAPASPDQVLILTTVIQSLVTMSFSLLFMPLQLTAMTVVYFDLRVRIEGLDLALQSTSAEAGLISLPEVPGRSPMRFLTGTDVAYFVLLSLGAAAIFALFYSVILGIVFASMSSI